MALQLHILKSFKNLDNNNKIMTLASYESLLLSCCWFSFQHYIFSPTFFACHFSCSRKGKRTSFAVRMIQATLATIHSQWRKMLPLA